mgnify:CR=1 FL=1
MFADVTTSLDIAATNGDRVDHARVLQTVVYPETLGVLQLDFGMLVKRVPGLKVTLIDAGSGKRVRVQRPGQAQTIPLP